MVGLQTAMLHLDGVPLSMLRLDGLVPFLEHHGGVRQLSAAFVSQGPLPALGQSVHVVQGELAVVRLHEAPAVTAIGSRHVAASCTHVQDCTRCSVVLHLTERLVIPLLSSWAATPPPA